MYTIVITIIIHNIIQAMIQADAILSTFTLLFAARCCCVNIFSTIEYSSYDVVHAMML